MNTAKQSRAEQVNQVIRIIGNHGHRALYNERLGTYAKVEVDPRGRVWLHDESTRARIYVHPTPWENSWPGFSHGGTLRGLIEAFCEFIRTGVPVSPYFLGLERQTSEGGNVWGYDDVSMQAVRKLAGAIPVFKQQQMQDQHQPTTAATECSQ